MAEGLLDPRTIRELAAELERITQTPAMRERLTTGEIPVSKAYLSAMIDRVEFDDAQIAGVKAQHEGARLFGARVAKPLEHAQIAARGERVASAGENHGAHVAVRAELLDGFVERVAELGGHRVATARVVEREGRDVTMHLGAHHGDVLAHRALRARSRADRRGS